MFLQERNSVDFLLGHIYTNVSMPTQVIARPDTKVTVYFYKEIAVWLGTN